MSINRNNLVQSLNELREFDTALLANTIGYIDSTPTHEFYMGGSIGCLTPEIAPTVGIAVTCELDSSSPNSKPDTELFWRQLEEMDRSKVPTIWVVKTFGPRPDHECVLGDGMAKMLASVGCMGVVTDGGVRDLRSFPGIPFAAYGKGKTIHHCALRFRNGNSPIKVGGITVRPGDVLHANEEGVIRIPETCIASLPERAVAMRAFEQDTHRHLRRTDLAPADKRKLIERILGQYGFGPKQEPVPQAFEL